MTEVCFTENEYISGITKKAVNIYNKLVLVKISDAVFLINGILFPVFLL